MEDEKKLFIANLSQLFAEAKVQMISVMVIFRKPPLVWGNLGNSKLSMNSRMH